MANLALQHRISSNKSNSSGFTLLELLVVLVIIAAMAGAAIFFATPSATQREQQAGNKVFELMHKARLQAMLERRIYGLDLSEQRTMLRLVVMSQDVYSSYNNASLDAAEDDEALTPEDTSIFSPIPQLLTDEEDVEAEEPPSFAEYMQEANSLGLIFSYQETIWEPTQNERDTIVLPEGMVLDLLVPVVPLEEQNIGLDDAADDNDLYDNDDEAAGVQPVLLFLPDGRLSSAGSLNFINQEGAEVFSFDWDRLGKFEKATR